MYKEEYYDYSGKEGKRIREDLKNWGFHHLTISRLPADFFRMSRSQLEKLFEHASDAFIARMYDIPEYQIEKRRDDFGIKQLGCTLNRMEREEETAQSFKEILRIVSNEYNNGNIPHTNSTPLNSEKEFLYMKATGIVRRIDDLGRIVIPKEIRKTFHIKESDPMEIFINGEGEIILKKYSPMGEMTGFAKQYAESLAQASGHIAVITDRDTVVAVSGGLKSMQGKRVSKGLEECMQARELLMASKGERGFVQITEDNQEDISDIAVGTILAAGDVVGSVCLLDTKGQAQFGEVERKLILTATGFIGKHLEL